MRKGIWLPHASLRAHWTDRSQCTVQFSIVGRHVGATGETEKTWSLQEKRTLWLYELAMRLPTNSAFWMSHDLRTQRSPRAFRLETAVSSSSSPYVRVKLIS